MKSKITSQVSNSRISLWWVPRKLNCKEIESLDETNDNLFFPFFIEFIYWVTPKIDWGGEEVIDFWWKKKHWLSYKELEVVFLKGA